MTVDHFVRLINGALSDAFNGSLTDYGWRGNDMEKDYTAVRDALLDLRARQQ